MNDAELSLFEQVRRFDESRPSIPGEHWLAVGVGLYLLLRGRPTVLGRLASMALGTAFVARGVSGRDGAIAVLIGPKPQRATARAAFNGA